MKTAKRLLSLILAVLLGVLPLTGCGTQALSGNSGSIDPDPSGTGASRAGDVPDSPGLYPTIFTVTGDAAPLPEFDRTAEYDAVCRAVNGFSFRMTSALLGGRTENFVCSPLSAAFVLASVLNGAGEDVRQELLAAMGLDGMDMDAVNRGFSMLLSRLTVPDRYMLEDNPDYTTPVEIANALFVSQNYTLRTDFAQAVLDAYRSEAFSVDFSSQHAVQAINDWCSEKTHGLIPSIVEELDPDTAAAVSNAIYFSDRWSQEFNPDENETRVFHAPEGDRNAEFMFRQGDFIRYFEDDAMQAVELPFVRGGGLMVLLPGEESGVSPAELLASLDAAGFGTLLDSFEERSGLLRLPKFRLDTMTSLSDALEALGLGKLFNPGSPAVTGMVEEGPLFISEALQKAAIDVSETGTTAAAVTVMLEEGCCIMVPDETVPFKMICDRPFAFILYGKNPAHILFTGTVSNPAE